MSKSDPSINPGSAPRFNYRQCFKLAYGAKTGMPQYAGSGSSPIRRTVSAEALAQRRIRETVGTPPLAENLEGPQGPAQEQNCEGIASEPVKGPVFKRIGVRPLTAREEQDLADLAGRKHTVDDFYSLKLDALVRRCEQIPKELRLKVVEMVLGDGTLSSDGDAYGLRGLIAAAAERLGIVEMINSDCPTAADGMAHKLPVPLPESSASSAALKDNEEQDSAAHSWSFTIDPTRNGHAAPLPSWLSPLSGFKYLPVTRFP